MTTRSIERRAFLKRTATAAIAVLGAPLLTSRAAAQGERLVVALGQWGTETPFAWRHVQAEKPLWDCVYDPLILRDPNLLRLADEALAEHKIIGAFTQKNQETEQPGPEDRHRQVVR